ncbi:MAG: sterol desaturase family protein [Archangium sp.]|nr:sterol desaturase family protein [Archangium sp.]
MTPLNPQDVPVALQFAAAFLPQAIGYFVFIGLVFLLFHRTQLFVTRRIQNPARLDSAQLVRETGYSLLTMLFASSLPVLLLGSGAVKVRQTTDGWATWELVGLWIALLILNDAWFYATHRLLHTEWLFKRVHSWHHRSIDVNPFTTYAFHPLEGFILTAWVVPVLFLIPVPMPLLMSMQAVGLLNNLNAHLGYELQPKFFIRIPPFSWLTSSTFHNQHHAHVTGNYGLMFRVWDKLFRTERADYEERFLKRGEKAP